MRNLLNDFIGLFSITSTSIIKETLVELNISFKTTDIITIPTSEEANKKINFLNVRDNLNISVLIGDDDPIDYYSNDEPGVFFIELSNRLRIRDDDEPIEISFIITKNKVDGVLSIYFPNEILKFLETLDLKGLLYVLYKEFNPQHYLILESQIDEINFNTNSIWVTNKKNDRFDIANLVARQDKIGVSKTVCNFNLINEYQFIPNDFFIIESSNHLFKSIFNRLCVTYSLAYLFDILTVENSSIGYKLNGYKSINGSIDFQNIKPEQSQEYFKIYEWCYDGGNFSDKIGLSRNIISLHFESPTTIELKGNPYQSIQSSYKVYEKQNIKQYIEVRNKISDQLLGFHDRADKIIDTFASGFQKSALALISFYISAIVLKLLGKPSLVNIFTLDVTVLSSVFIACSYLYFRYSLKEVNEQKQRFVNSYTNLKERYLDLLDSVDIQRILNSDKEFNSDLAFINKKCEAYSKMWKYYLLLLFLMTLSLYLYYHITNLFNTQIWHYLFIKCRCY